MFALDASCAEALNHLRPLLVSRGADTADVREIELSKAEAAISEAISEAGERHAAAAMELARLVHELLGCLSAHTAGVQQQFASCSLSRSAVAPAGGVAPSILTH